MSEFGIKFQIVPSSTSYNVSSFVISKPLATMKILRGEDIEFPDQTKLKFLGHSHKTQMAGDSHESPLMVTAQFKIKSKDTFDTYTASL